MKPSERILVVEDDEGVAVLQRKRLERIGYTVLIASNCEEALTHATSGVDVVVLDYWLGNATGLEVCKQLRAADIDVPVVMVTGSSEETTVIQALRSGVRDFVPKDAQYLDYLPQAVDRVLQQKRTEKRLMELEARRLQSQKMEALGQLAGGVAHEFNNLLQIIQGFTEAVIEEHRDRPEIGAELGEVLNAASKAATLTGQLLTFGRRQSMEMEALDLQHLIEDTVKMLRPLLGPEIAIEIVADPQLAPVWGCSTMLGQVVMNLCLNARDAMPGGGRLTISCSNAAPSRPPDCTSPGPAPGAWVRLVVSDTGAGIAPEHLPHLFEPFFTTKPVGRGTGLGLATVFGIVEEHAGTIEVRSIVGEGTSLEILLPQAQCRASSHAPVPVDSAGGTETILLAEDEAGVRQYLEHALAQAGYRVLAAADGEAAVELFHHHQDEIELFLLDIVMPKMSGREVCRTIRALRPGMKGAFISGYDPRSGMPDGGDGDDIPILRKPVGRQDLLRIVREMLDESQKGDLSGDKPVTACSAMIRAYWPAG